MSSKQKAIVLTGIPCSVSQHCRPAASASHPLFDFEAQEHTAQVDAPRRQLLEQRFRYTEKTGRIGRRTPPTKRRWSGCR